MMTLASNDELSGATALVWGWIDGTLSAQLDDLVAPLDHRDDPLDHGSNHASRAVRRVRGELRDAPWTPPSDPLPAEAREALRDWVDSGDDDRAVAELVADDPDLATQL